MSNPSPNTDKEELTAQLTLLFYGEEALQDYRRDGDVTITVYQAVALIQDRDKALVREVLESLPEKRGHLEGSGGSGGIPSKSWMVASTPDELAFNNCLAVVSALLRKRLEE